MKRSAKPSIEPGALSSLIEKFSHQDIIAEMEKEYQSAPTKLISISLLDDNAYVQEVVLPEEVVAAFAQGLQHKGFYNPLAVRKKSDGRYEIILGRKRFFAAKKAGILSLPCAVLDVGDEEMLLMLLADTRDQRESNVVEMALVCQQLATQFGYTQQMLADLSHQSRSQITNILRILKLPFSIRQEVCLGQLSYGHARALACCSEAEAKKTVERIHADHLSVRQTEQLVQHSLPSTANDDCVKGLEAELGAKISVRKGKATFAFSHEEDCEKFLQSLAKREN